MEKRELEPKNLGLQLLFPNWKLHGTHWTYDQLKQSWPTYNYFDVVGRKYPRLISIFSSIPICIYFFQKINNFSRSEIQIINLLCCKVMKNNSMRSTTVNRLLSVAWILRGKTGLWMKYAGWVLDLQSLWDQFFFLIRVLLTLWVQDAKHTVEPNKRINIKLKRNVSLPREAEITQL